VRRGEKTTVAAVEALIEDASNGDRDALRYSDDPAAMTAILKHVVERVQNQVNG
jgi:hypothetical protein